MIEEMKQMKALILGMNEISGTSKDVKRIARILLNKTTKDKVISKQECMCHLAKLDLFLCSEAMKQSAYLESTVFVHLVNLTFHF